MLDLVLPWGNRVPLTAGHFPGFELHVPSHYTPLISISVPASSLHSMVRLLAHTWPAKPAQGVQGAAEPRAGPSGHLA